MCWKAALHMLSFRQCWFRFLALFILSHHVHNRFKCNFANFQPALYCYYVCKCNVNEKKHIIQQNFDSSTAFMKTTDYTSTFLYPLQKKNVFLKRSSKRCHMFFRAKLFFCHIQQTFPHYPLAVCSLNTL